MGRKFMIVKPSPCCSCFDLVGKVRESEHRDIFPISECGMCGQEFILNDPVPYTHNGAQYVIPESRIVWLPDEQDVLDHDEQLELTA